jgi:hypothetical protein
MAGQHTPGGTSARGAGSLRNEGCLDGTSCPFQTRRTSLCTALRVIPSSLRHALRRSRSKQQGNSASAVAPLWSLIFSAFKTSRAPELETAEEARISERSEFPCRAVYGEEHRAPAEGQLVLSPPSLGRRPRLYSAHPCASPFGPALPLRTAPAVRWLLLPRQKWLVPKGHESSASVNKSAEQPLNPATSPTPPSESPPHCPPVAGPATAGHRPPRR